MTWLRDTLNNKGARAKCLKWAYFALATSLHVLAKVTKWPYLNSGFFCQIFGRNKFKIDLFKNVAKIAILRPKIGHIPLLSLDINGHNSIIFHPILTFFILNCLCLRDESNGVQIKALPLLVKILVFGTFFAPRPHMGKIVRMDIVGA